MNQLKLLSAVSVAFAATATTLVTGLQEFCTTRMTVMRKDTPYSIKDSMSHGSSLLIGTLK
jgi:hypothetical protein